MKNILTTLLVLFALVVNAQSDTTQCKCTYDKTITQYHYYVVYNKETSIGYQIGSCTVTINSKIENDETIDLLKCCLKLPKNSLFTNWILMKTIQPKNKKK